MTGSSFADNKRLHDTAYDLKSMASCPICAADLAGFTATCPTCGASLEGLSLAVGTLIGAKYRIEAVLGQGGFGITYLAFHQALGERVAIKELFPEGSTRRGRHVVPPAELDFLEMKTKFLEEAITMQRFEHPNIVRIYNTFQVNSTAYIVMEALEGKTLGTALAADGAFPEARVLEIAWQLCDALTVVHAAGLLHRDVKPDNVFLSSSSQVILIDFGSARAFARGKLKRLTRLVTPGYAAPEQYATQAKFGTYTDVYGLAATLFHALEGQPPPTAPELMLGTKLEFRRAQQLRSGIELGLRVKVSERPPTVTAFLALLERLADTSAIGSAGVSQPMIATTVSGWRFEQTTFRKGLRKISYQSVHSIKVINENDWDSYLPRRKRIELNEFIFLVGFSSVVIGVQEGFIYYFTGIFLIFVSIFIWLIRKKGNPIKPQRFVVLTNGFLGAQDLETFDDKRTAVDFARTIQRYTNARLAILT